MNIRPFSAVRPTPEKASAVAAVPYDVVDTAEARALAAGNPASFLHVSRPEIDMPEGIRRLWDSRHIPYADGYFDAYYDGLLRLFAMMHLSGRYRIIKPSAETKEPAD